jgi:hypothetical protein
MQVRIVLRLSGQTKKRPNWTGANVNPNKIHLKFDGLNECQFVVGALVRHQC